MRIDDIVHVIEQLGGDGIYKMTGDHAMFSCVNAPWAHDSGADSTKKLGVRVGAGMALVNCFRPGCVHGTLLHLVREVGGKRVGEGMMAPDELSNLKAFVLLAEDEIDDPDAPKDGPIMQPLPAEVMSAIGKGSQYWRSRGVSAEAEAVWQLAEVGGRAYIPIFGPDGTIRGVQGRLVDQIAQDEDGHDEKYRTMPVGFKKGEYLVGAPDKQGPADLVIVVESPVDALTLQDWLDQRPPDGATRRVVATMGAKITKAQEALLLRALTPTGELCLGMDTDPAGRLAARQLGDALWRRVPLLSVVTWEGKDPTDADVQDAQASALQAIDVRSPWILNRMEAALTTV